VARILIIEDNPGNLELMTYLLGAFGHVALVAEDGERGVESARAQRPDLVLCDIQLPGMDGYAVVRALKADPATAAIPVVAVSALAMASDIERGRAAGFDGYVAKPIEPQQFLAQVDGYLSADRRGARADAATPASAEASAPVPAAPHRARVVMVDDSTTNRELIYHTLSPSGYEVDVVDNVLEALRRLRERGADLILSDLHMPGEDGFDFMRAVKADARLATIPFVFITSSVWGEGERERALALGVDRFLLRPIEPQVLLAEIAACLEERGGG
jgi:two-component system cell cycle response regulator